MTPLSASALRPRSPARPWLVIAAGGAVIGTLDLAFAILFWLRHDVAPVRILQSIARGWLGDAAFEGGAAAAWLGAVSHYCIATMFVVAYYLAARRMPKLLAHPVRNGLGYGVLLYLAMNFVVLPLSAAGLPGFGNTAWVVGSVLAHAVFGVLSACFASIATGAGPGAAPVSAPNPAP
jgi:uncharacterized membrane protein YagU involved in acid resistance